MNKRLVWFTELFLWAILIVAVTLGFTYSFAKADQKNHSYYMFFKDVDGLAQGSPVRMMGYQIGYVKDVKVFKDNIFVSFLVTTKNIYIPNGSVACVEFYGLGGSKSLEIKPPTAETLSKKDEAIITKNPYRVSDYYNWGSQINSTIEVMATNASANLDAFIKDGVNLPFLNENAQKINTMIQSFIKSEDNFINKLNNKFSDFNNKYKNIKNNNKDETVVPEKKEITK